MKTHVYIDGFSLYLGCVKASGCKWLDLFSLFKELNKIANRDSSLELDLCYFFTADIKSKFSSHGNKANESQQKYLRSLLQLYPSQIEIIKGNYFAREERAMRYINPPDKNDRLSVWKLEEKQTDVRMALQIYHDAVHKMSDQIIICTSDTDIIPALEFSKSVNNDLRIGIISPRPQNDDISTNMSTIYQYADWHLPYISSELLLQHQLPERIPTNKRPIIKPDYW